MKLALILNVIDPLIGGVLIMGHRGTGKSTAVRGLAELLPEIEVVSDCLYRCSPTARENLCHTCAQRWKKKRKLKSEKVPVRVVELPLGATEDRVCGTIDIERAMQAGAKAFAPGLLAQANRGFLYIDEVNLLEDHLVDVLLDAAATGRNNVERESISIEHPSQFVLVGSGNPEEGELRPQLQDRFGLHVEVTTENSPDLRVSVVRKRVAFDQDAEAFLQASSADQERLRQQIGQAQSKLAEVKLDRTVLRKIAELCSELEIDGHRGELTIARAASALAAFEGRRRVGAEEIRRVAIMSLRHRLRRDPLEETASGRQISEALDRAFPSQGNTRQDKSGGDRDPQSEKQRNGDTQVESSNLESRVVRVGPATAASPKGEEDPEGVATPADKPAAMARISDFTVAGLRSQSGNSGASNSRGRRGKATKSGNVQGERGRYQRAVMEKTARVAWDATLRAAAMQQMSAVAEPGHKSMIPVEALRYKLLVRKQGPLFIFAIDTSGSMALRRIALARRALLDLLKKSYLARDRVAIVAFSGTNAKLLLPPTRSILRARCILDSLTVGGGTPLPAGLNCSLDLARRVSGHLGLSSVLMLFTDGGANVSLSRPGEPDPVQRRHLIDEEIKFLSKELRHSQVRVLVVDTDDPFRANGKAKELAVKLNAQVVRISNPFVSSQ